MSYHANQSHTPEQRLAAAMFNNSLRDAFLDRVEIPKSERPRARRWLFTQPLSFVEPFTFTFTCEALNLDAARVRNELSRLWTYEPEWLVALVERYLDFNNPLISYSDEATYIAPFQIDEKSGQFLMFGERLAA